jgi:uncharacterized protein (DUF1697 family)
MATTYLALLRGINVGKAKRVSMGDLRALLEGLGHTDVATVGVSGNAVFTSSSRGPASSLAAAVERAISSTLGMDVRVLVLSVADLRRVLDANPMPDEAAQDPSRFHVGFALDGKVDRPALQPVLEADWSPEAVAVGKGVVYAWHPNGVTGSKLAEALAKAQGGGSASTARNWATLTKLLDRAGGGPASPAAGRRASGPARASTGRTAAPRGTARG